MNLYYAAHNGIYLEGFSSAFAYTPDGAEKLIEDMLKEYNGGITPDEDERYDVRIYKIFPNIIEPLNTKP
tara:strand:+ start:141 stop:350 length:210 start_codon:yes stop_codon:yes gene_type:complete